jgi:hypothetical protein
VSIASEFREGPSQQLVNTSKLLSWSSLSFSKNKTYGPCLALLRACLARDRVGSEEPQIGFPWGWEAAWELFLQGNFLCFRTALGKEGSDKSSAYAVVCKIL